jgi:serine/threonine protein kinase
MGCTQSTAASPAVKPKHFIGENLIVEKNKNFNQDYKVIKQVGEGSISNIYLVSKKLSSFKSGSASMRGFKQEIDDAKSGNSEIYYALKEIDMELIEPEFLVEMRNEINLLKKIDHPNVLRAYEVYQDGKEHISIVMELCSGGDLNNRTPYTEDQARKIVAKIVEAINYLHSKCS